MLSLPVFLFILILILIYPCRPRLGRTFSGRDRGGEGKGESKGRLSGKADY